ncbi:MAG: KH domain-containing protein [Coriobacteriales bacterium]|jgi:predicted RNA-binding protein YlqC (UPF0109 family)|nr:KH domain-containing protein [Coriobacteriales bacterium]
MAGQQGDAVGLVQSIIVSLVDDPEQVSITSSQNDDTLVIEVHVAPDDTGKVIGRQGRIIKAIRTLTRAASSYAGGARIEVEVMDQETLG